MTTTNPTDSEMDNAWRMQYPHEPGDIFGIRNLPSPRDAFEDGFRAGVATHNTPSREQIAKTISRALGVTSSKNAIAYAPVNYLPAADAVLALLAPTGNEAGE
jgi:hypothetical protein